MKDQEFKDFKLIMSILSEHSKKDIIQTPSLSGMENRVLSKIDIIKLKKEVRILRRLEYVLIFTMFMFLLFLFPGQIGRWINDYLHNSGSEVLPVQEVEYVVNEVEGSLEDYLNTEMDLNPLFINEDLLSDEY